jgi:hypothetical protein
MRNDRLDRLVMLGVMLESCRLRKQNQQGQQPVVVLLLVLVDARRVRAWDSVCILN